jgi:hypothetical protein
MMLTDDIRSFLEKPRIAFLSTIDMRGFPHTVPAWFAVDGDDLITSAGEGRARVRNIQANSKGAIAIGGNLDETQGYMFKGNLSIEEDPNRALLKQIIRHYMGEDGVEPFLASAGQVKRLILRLTPTNIIGHKI